MNAHWVARTPQKCEAKCQQRDAILREVYKDIRVIASENHVSQFKEKPKKMYERREELGR